MFGRATIRLGIGPHSSINIENENQSWVHIECNAGILNPILIFDPHNPGIGNIHFSLFTRGNYRQVCTMFGTLESQSLVATSTTAQCCQLQGWYSRMPSRCEDVGHRH